MCVGKILSLRLTEPDLLPLEPVIDAFLIVCCYVSMIITMEVYITNVLVLILVLEWDMINVIFRDYR